METHRAPFKILFQDQDLVVIDKPAGFHVHPPESSPVKIPRDKICLSVLRAQIGCYVYPVHRLDVATSGILVWALNREAASSLCRDFSQQEIQKTYHVVVRGWTPDHFTVDLPLESDSSLNIQEARTEFETLKKIELDVPVGKKFPKARYSFLKAQPKTGRYHQIRRHLNRISHPIIGDTDHGDSHHNRFFRMNLGNQGLCLRAVEISFAHPRTKEVLKIQAPQTEKWQGLDAIFRNHGLKKEITETSHTESILLSEK